MMRLLIKYRVNIILFVLLTILAFWFNPTQKDLYLEADFESLEQKSTRFLLWTMGIGAIIILVIIAKDAKKIVEVGSALFGIVVLSIPIFIFFQMIFLSGFLALNRIERSGQLEKKYTTTFFFGTDKQTPIIYDYRAKKTLLFDKVGRIEKLNNLKTGDTLVISFRKGLLGIPFDPVIK